MKTWPLLLLLAPALFASCASTDDSARAEELCRALDREEYDLVQTQLPALAQENASAGTRVVDYGLGLVEMPPDAAADVLPQMRRLLAALDVPGPLQTRVGFGRGLAAMKAGDDAAALVHFETLVATSDAQAADRAAAYFALAVLDPDPDGLPNRAHWAHYRRLTSEGAEGVDAGLVAQLDQLLGDGSGEALAKHRDL